jgi:glutaredoxin 3
MMTVAGAVSSCNSKTLRSDKMVTVKVYSTPVCPWCERAKQFLKEHNIPFEEIDVSMNHQAALEMIQKSGQQGVPVIEIDGKMIVGFDKEALEKALKIKE